jgi:pilus assembly protein CpaC
MKRKKHFLKVLLVVSIACAALLSSHKLVFSKMYDDSRFRSADSDLHILVGDIDTIWTQALTRIAVANPSIADVIETKTTEALIVGKAPGKTDIYIWDKYGKRKVTVWVFIENLDLAEARIKELLKSAEIANLSLARSDLEGKLVISGEVEEKDKKAFDEIIAPFAGSIVNLAMEKQKRELIEIDVQISEVSSTFASNIGIEWTNEGLVGGNYFRFNEELPDENVQTFTDIFKIGNMSRTDTIQAKINTLIAEGKGKVLSKPKLVTKSGEEASFLVGGEVPITTTTTSSGGNVQEDVEYKEYGVNLKIKATVREDDKIDVDLMVDVTDIDYATTRSGDNYAYTSRSAQTKLFLDNGQTIILAGFMKDNKSETVKRFPLLGSLPIFGFLFRNKTIAPDSQTELFITLTPRIVAANEKQKKEEAKESSQETKVQEGKKQNVITSLAKTETQTTTPAYQPIVMPEKMASYVRSIQEHIAKNVYYPKLAKESKAQGAVEINLSIIKSGALVAASVSKSSGSKMLDEAALETVQRLSPYRAFPSDVTLKQLTVTIPIVYQLD